MRNGNKVIVELAILVTLTLVDPALAYYNASAGRFLTRDPVGEPGATLIQLDAGTTGLVPRDAVVPRRAQPSRGIARHLSSSQQEPHVYCAVQNNPLSWIDPDGAMSIYSPCNPQYPPPNPPRGAKYDCVGLACRTYTSGQSADPMLQRFRIGGDCSLACKPCELKCWMWDYDESVQGPDGNYVGFNNGATTVHGSHIVCGQVGPDGSAPQCYDKFAEWGELRGPGDCASYKPPESEPVKGIPGYRWVRSNFSCHAFCGPASAVYGLKH
jgi:hypothetical protein